MGFLSSLFGGGSSKPATTTNVVSQKLPTEISPYVSQILKEGAAQFEADKAAGYQPYTGETTAQLTAQQEAALTGLEGLAGTQQPFLDEAGQIVRGAAEKFTGDTAQQYMSPYQQAVTDIELREAQRRFEGDTLPRLEAQAVGMGGMSGLGSRAGVEMAEAQRSQNQLLADIQAKGQQKAFESARKEYGLQKAREREMASDITGLGRQEVTAGLAELGALKSAGEERQQLAQSALDEAFLKYQQEQQFPKQNLAEFSQLVYGNPLVKMPTRSTTTTDTPYQPSTGQQLLGLGMGAANIYGMGGGFGADGFSRNVFSKNVFGANEGGQIEGGLSELIERKTGEQILPDAATTSFKEEAIKKELKRIDELPAGQGKELAKRQLAFLNPDKQRKLFKGRQDVLGETMKGSISSLLGKKKKGIGDIAIKRDQGVREEMSAIDAESEAGKKRINDLMKQLGPADVGGRGLKYKQTEQGFLGDLVASLGATTEAGFDTIRENKARKREDDLLKAGKLEEVAKESRLQKRGLRKEQRTGELSDVEKITSATYDAAKAEDKIQIDKVTAAIGLEQKLDKYPVEIQKAVMDGIKSDLQLEELREKINKLKSETKENLAEAASGEIPKLMKSAEYEKIMKSANLANNVTIDVNGRVKQGGVPLSSQGALGVLVDIQTALKAWPGQGAAKYKAMQNSLVKSSVEKIIDSMPMKYKIGDKIKKKVIGLKKAKQIIASGDTAKIEGLKSMLDQSDFSKDEIKSIIEALK